MVLKNFREVLTLSQGTEELWAVIFLPVAAFRALIFCPPRCSELHSVQWGHLFSGTCGIQCRQCWRLQNSVPERASYGTEYACRAQKGFLRYATRFLKPSVLKTGFWGTEGIFGTGNALLRYATHLQRRKTADSADCGQPSDTPDAFSEAQDSLLPHRTHFLMRAENLDNPALIVKGKTQPDFPWLPYSGIASSTKRTLGCPTVLKNIS